ncbi:unnamed protein product [Effrenium voratum]|nr:unnamed protein product [Effrenium voratum]
MATKPKSFRCEVHVELPKLCGTIVSGLELHSGLSRAALGMTISCQVFDCGRFLPAQDGQLSAHRVHIAKKSSHLRSSRSSEDSASAVAIACCLGSACSSELAYFFTSKRIQRIQVHLEFGGLATASIMLFVGSLSPHPADAFWKERDVDGQMEAGLFVGWSFKTFAALLGSVLQSWLGGLVSKRLSTVVRSVAQCLSLLIIYFFGDLVLKKLEFDWIVGAAAIIVALSVQARSNVNARPKRLKPGEKVQCAVRAADVQARATMIAAISNLSTAYNLVNCNLTNEPLAITRGANAYWEKGLHLTMVMSITGALVSAFAVPLDPKNPASVFIFLCISRFILGVGVGGVYPLAATVAAEGSDSSSRGQSVAMVFSMQGVGQLMVPLVGMACLYAFGDEMDRAEDRFSPSVLHSVFHAGTGETPVIGDSIKNNLCWQLTILALLGLPGYYVAVCYMDKLGRKVIQIQGFAMMALLYLGLALFLDKMEELPALLLFVYGLTYFFSNFGPNSTTFILPSESFPREVRSTLNGFCAASGKMGAVVGSALFKPLILAFGTSFVFLCCAVCAVLGIIITTFCVEDRHGARLGQWARRNA